MFGLKIRDLPPRLAVGAYILNSGLSKRQADDETAKGLHHAAAGAYPVLEQVEPTRFVRTLSTTEIALGSALLTPFVPTAVAAAGLGAFAGALLGMYLRTPGLRQEGSIRPSPDGLALAKDVWMAGIATGMIADAVAHRGDDD